MFTYRGYSILANITPGMTLVLVLALAWTMVWKGIALWKAGRNGQAGWFVALFVVNTLGILEIIYIYFFQKKQA